MIIKLPACNGFVGKYLSRINSGTKSCFCMMKNPIWTDLTAFLLLAWSKRKPRLLLVRVAESGSLIIYGLIYFYGLSDLDLYKPQNITRDILKYWIPLHCGRVLSCLVRRLLECFNRMKLPLVVWNILKIGYGHIKFVLYHRKLSILTST